MIIWRSDMAVGHEVIDVDHRHLIALLNCVELAILTRQEKAVFRWVLDELTSYSARHFEREEALQVEVGYPQASAHAACHRVLSVQLLNVRNKLERQADGDGVGPGLLELMKSWLLDHILREDLKMRPYFDSPLERLV